MRHACFVVSSILTFFVGCSSSASGVGTGGDSGTGPSTSSGGMKVIFVTSASYLGDLGGLSGGDARCNQAAQNGHLSGSFTAYLSDSNTNGIDRISDVGPWYTVVTNGSPATVSLNRKADLLVALPMINDELGTPTGRQYVWTGYEAGKTNAAACSDWASSDASVLGAASSTDSSPGYQTFSCNGEDTLGNRLLCIQQ